jgi:hypothetical protein
MVRSSGHQRLIRQPTIDLVAKAMPGAFRGERRRTAWAIRVGASVAANSFARCGKFMATARATRRSMRRTAHRVLAGERPAIARAFVLLGTFVRRGVERRVLAEAHDVLNGLRHRI